MYDCLPSGVLELGLATLVHFVPGPDQSGSVQPLYAHVCHPVEGRRGPEPQESGFQPKLDSAPILYQQGLLRSSSFPDASTNSSRFRVDRPVCLLCPERAVLHRSLPAVVLLSNVVAVSPAAVLGLPEPTPPATSTDSVRQSIQCRSPGARPGQQD